MLRVSQTEQNKDYSYEIAEEISKVLKHNDIGHVLAALTQRLLRLDYLGYLHAQFHNSPVFRMRLIGRSMNADLSHLERSFPNKKSVIAKIGAIGKRLSELLLSKELKQLLKDRNGQLVFISDLPMEWTKLGNYPLCLTHDICRIPEFNLRSLVNNFMHNQRLNFTIKPDIIKRTLVIHCASEKDTDMHVYFELYKNLQDTLGFISIVCKNVEEISQAVKEIRPDLLIFDCHGDFGRRGSFQFSNH